MPQRFGSVIPSELELGDLADPHEQFRQWGSLGRVIDHQGSRNVWKRSFKGSVHLQLWLSYQRLTISKLTW